MKREVDKILLQLIHTYTLQMKTENIATFKIKLIQIAPNCVLEYGIKKRFKIGKTELESLNLKMMV